MTAPQIVPLKPFTFQADYYPGQSVQLVALERPGVVEMVRIGESDFAEYFVTWWDEGKRCSEWLPGRELKK